jgi:hypothetical protein
MQCSTTHFGINLETYPATWDDETKSIAFMASVTARYYARGLACSDPNLLHVQHLCAEVVYDRLQEIERRGWTARADKYMQFEGSAFSLPAMLRWAYDKRREALEWRLALAERIANGGQSKRATASRFRTE